MSETFTPDEIADVFWDYLKRDPEHKDCRRTAWGTKTKQGLAETIVRLGSTAKRPHKTHQDA